MPLKLSVRSRATYLWPKRPHLRPFWGKKMGKTEKFFQKFWLFGLLRPDYSLNRVFFTIKVVLLLTKNDRKAFWEFLLSKKIGKFFYYEKWVVYPPFGLNLGPFPLTHSNNMPLKLSVGSRATYFRPKRPHFRPFWGQKRGKTENFFKKFWLFWLLRSYSTLNRFFLL